MSKAKNYRDTYQSLHRMGMPSNLVHMLKAGTLAQHVLQAYASLDAMNEFLDAWEERCAAAAAVTPWADRRAAWKAAGRPQPNWLEILVWYEQQQLYVPISANEVAKDLLMLHSPQIQASKKRRRTRIPD
jgi:hypothetical protein